MSEVLTEAVPAAVASDVPVERACVLPPHRRHALDCELRAAAARGVGRVYLGSEFCEHLLPTPAEFTRQLGAVSSAGLAPTLATPLAGDAAVARIVGLAGRLPAGAEVVCNDWGVAARLRREGLSLRLVAGRMLCKSVKDPRLPSAQWLKLAPHGLAASTFVALLARLDFARMELDVPPFADPGFFAGLPLPVHVHGGFGYAAKGRVCRIGGLAERGPSRFAPASPCRRECLDYVTTTQRAGADADLPTVLAGNTIFYRHSAAMAAAVDAAVMRGSIRRIVEAGEP